MPSILRASIIYKTLMSNWRRFLRASPSLRSSASSPGTRSGTYLAPRKQWGPLGRLLRPPKAMGPLGDLVRSQKAIVQWLIRTFATDAFGALARPPHFTERPRGARVRSEE